MIIVSGCRALSFDLFVIHFTEKQMDNKEVSDPLTSVTLIKGNSTLTINFLFFFFLTECLYTNEHQVALFLHDAPDKKRREKKGKKKKIKPHESHLGASVAIRGRLLAGDLKVPGITFI